MSIEGGCLCGAVRYRIETEPMPACYACHCTDCQTQSGSAFGLQMPLFGTMLDVKGELGKGQRQTADGIAVSYWTCAKCAVRIYAENTARPGIVVLRAGTLDESSALVPRAHLWVRSKQPWLVLPEDAILYDTQPETQQEWMTILGLGGADA
ncbi:GFA family protein [Parasphingopyxis algicola]|uniref:GFA family protein n=1 Tax=Parasphingopyxis algicola TaxID=2026624 RepID=UPI0015A2D03C|nr:GFA family protein [Parasphingopyxis algicola]QLC24277.1 GFA family protein [Parasphingopyxis algicola]